MAQFYAEDRQRQRRRLTDQAIRSALENRWEDAVASNRQLLELDPNSVEALNRLGKAYSELGHYAEARAAYARALELDRTNTIAQKNLTRLEKVLEDVAPAESREQIDPRLFIEETGKTGHAHLIELGEPRVLAKMGAGDRVELRVAGRQLHAYNAQGEYLGEVHPRVGLRLIDMMTAGNRYIAALTHVSDQSARLFIREEFQHRSQVGRLSFPPKRELAVRPYIKGRVLDYGVEEEEDLEEAEYGTEAEGEADEAAERAESEDEEESPEL
ncbi:MAG: tetratricopeptide repeat protein [Chloroflexi bacterium]|nr:tetratricopeptide repeat protein [Chloroflexota bacterium]